MSAKFGVMQYDADTQEYAFHCPGCRYSHWIRTRGRRPNWTIKGGLERPTVQPSILVLPEYPSMRCHSLITDGKIQFLSDCWHPLAGQTVDLADWE